MPTYESLKFNRPLLIGHRGFKAFYPENTVVAFDAALMAGAQMVELDIHLTKDHELVVIHDDTLERTTNGNGAVVDHILAELKKLDAGSWFDQRFSGETIPTLKEVLYHLAGRLQINIEIKADLRPIPRPSGQIETAVLELLKQENALSYVLISSFDPHILENFNTFGKSPPLAFISESAEGMKTVALCKELNVFSFHPNFRCLNKELVRQCHAEGIYLFPYNVNTEPEYRQTLEYGADGLIVDDPAGFKRWHLQSQ